MQKIAQKGVSAKGVRKSPRATGKNLKLTRKLSNKKLVREMFNRYNTQKMARVFVAGGSRDGYNPDYVQSAFQLGKLIAQRDYQLAFGFSPKGMMGAVAQGVLEVWKRKDKNMPKPIQGVTTEHYQKLYPDDDLLKTVTDLVVSHTLEERKQNLLSADFVVFTPGGLGTLDELVYDCVAMQDGWLSVKPFIFFNVGGFFHHILEYLKDIHLKGFSDRMPFIVVDDLFEMEVVFDMIAFYRQKMQDKKMVVQIVDQIIHELPYVIEKCRQKGKVDVHKLLCDKERFLKNKTLAERQSLAREIETAYLNKEIQRMYDRLASTNRDTALVSRKLDVLRERMKNTEQSNGFY